MRLLALALLASACVGPIHGLYPSREGEAVTSIWVVSHGWHTGIVVRRQDVPDGLWPQLRDFAGSELVEVGWGERDFYMAPAGTSGMALRAAFRPGSSVLHVAGFSGPVERQFPAREIVEITLSRRGFEQLAAHKFGVLGMHDLRAKMAEKGVEEGGKTRLATISPTAMISLYPNPELKHVAEEVEATLVAIMKEAAG